MSFAQPVIGPRIETSTPRYAGLLLHYIEASLDSQEVVVPNWLARGSPKFTEWARHSESSGVALHVEVLRKRERFARNASSELQGLQN